MCISCGVECFGHCGCNDTSTEDLLNELEKDYKSGMIDEKKVKEEAMELLDTEDYISFLQDLDIEHESNIDFNDRDLNDNKIISNT